ncbi:MAG: signal peptidase I [Chloroflexi bacterium]|nr:MAG: signal peptidase I [Chloroflexota bacterium]MBL1195427.1 signal peptidase I [Chloroflexota bacterium]NOH12710.1 signal peptidase I [Chloroflexota bacterium]
MDFHDCFFLWGAVAIIGGILAIRNSFYIVVVNGVSMSPTLECGDRVLVFRYWPKKLVRPGQIVVVQRPTYILDANDTINLQNTPIIKRVLGTAGDTITTYFYDLPFPERSNQIAAYDDEGKRVWKVPTGHIFIKGDSIGTDSLTWGPVPLSQMFGVVITDLNAQ